MKIGELATATGCTVETIRFYEKNGLLPEAARTEANYRVYGPAHLEQLRFIRNCRALDMTQEEIRTLLGLKADPAQGCGAVNQLLDAHIGHVQARIDELQHLRQQLEALRHSCEREQDIQACGILQGLASMQTEDRVERQTHLG